MTPENAQPPKHIIDLAIEVAGWSPCRSKRGVVIFSGEDVISHGYNYKPRGFECDGSEKCKATCRDFAIHAEQQAVVNAAGRPQTAGADLLHVKAVDGVLVPSGGPSCAQCSKLVVASGVVGVWLYHDTGWKRYEAKDFHAKSMAAAESSLLLARQEIETLKGDKKALVTECKLLTHKVITCGVAATHPDAALTTTGAYADKWDSPQAQSVRELRARADAAESQLQILRAQHQQLIEQWRESAAHGDVCPINEFYDGPDAMRACADALAALHPPREEKQA